MHFRPKKKKQHPMMSAIKCGHTRYYKTRVRKVVLLHPIRNYIRFRIIKIVQASRKSHYDRLDFIRDERFFYFIRCTHTLPTIYKNVNCRCKKKRIEYEFFEKASRKIYKSNRPHLHTQICHNTYA